MEKISSVYILACKNRRSLYIGVTSDLVKRIWQHREKLLEGFSKKYNTVNLVWYEVHQTMQNAIEREKQLKSWNRKWKERIISKGNPNWKDLFQEIAG